MQKINRIGEINKNTYGSKMTIIEYNSAENIIVQFDNGYVTNGTYRYFENGNIKNPYDKTVYGVGYIGEGKYKVSKNGKNTLQYKYWNSMLQRCYDEKRIKKHPTYENKVVCEEWHNFQNFAKWFDENYYTTNNEIMNLDKDILYKGNKIYSPSTCIFVPQYINTLFIKCNGIRGEYPIGITFNKQLNKFHSQCRILNNNKQTQKHIGYYNSIEDAFYLGYKPFKEKYIKQKADEYKDKVPKELYDAMYAYEVEITD